MTSERLGRRDLLRLTTAAGVGLVAGCVGGSRPSAATSNRNRAMHARAIDLVVSPTNLGLRPGAAGVLAGTWRAPEVLLRHGLARRLRARVAHTLGRPEYHLDAERGTRIRNGRTLREYNLELASVVADSRARGSFPFVVGGECSQLLGGLYGLRRSSGRGLVHVDGHSDFFHPGNYDTAGRLGSAAGMDLALATGRGEPTLTEWPNLGGSLVADRDVMQVGERESNDPDYPFHEISETSIDQHTVQQVLAEGVAPTVRRIAQWLEARDITAAWLHIDLDVLDQHVMPAVDSPGSPGLSYSSLGELLAGILATGRMGGADVGIYDPDLDPTEAYAPAIVDCLVEALAPVVEAVHAS